MMGTPRRTGWKDEGPLMEGRWSSCHRAPLLQEDNSRGHLLREEWKHLEPHSRKCPDDDHSSTQNSTVKTGRGIRTDISPERMYKWPINNMKRQSTSTSLTNGDMQIKTTMRPIGTISQNCDGRGQRRKKTSVGRMWRNGPPARC